MPDLTPVTVTAPAYIWRPVLDAIRRAAYRAQRRARAHPPAHGGGNTNDLAADALGQALSAIEAAIDAAAVPEEPPPKSDGLDGIRQMLGRTVENGEPR